MFNYLKGIWRKIVSYNQPIFVSQCIEWESIPDHLKDSTGKPYEFDKGLLPTSSMVSESQRGFLLKEKYNKGGEHLVVLTLAKKIAAGDLLTFEQIKELRTQYNKRARFSTAKEDTMGYINFMLLGGHNTKIFLGLSCSFESTGMLAVSGLNPKNE
jgi:hypothetical protein